MAKFPPHRRREVILLLVLAAMVLVFFAPTLLTGQVLSQHDLSFLFYPGYVYYQEYVCQGALPLWNPYLACGEPFLADIERAVFYPPNLMYVFLPTSLAIVVSAAFHVLLGGVGTYGLSRTWGISPLSSLLAGMSYALSGYTLGKIAFPSELNSAAWFPVVLWAYAAWVKGRTRRRLLLTALAISSQFLAGFPEIVTFTVGSLLLYGLVAGWSDYRRLRTPLGLFRPLIGLAVAGVVALLLSMAQLLPTFEALEASARSHEADPRLDRFSLHPYALCTLFVRSVYGLGGSPGSYWAPTCSDYAVATFYLGIPPVVILVAAAIRWLTRAPGRSAKKHPSGEQIGMCVPFLFLLFIFFFLYAMGKYTPFYGLLRGAIPLLQHFVSPLKCLLCVVLALACLAAIGLDTLARESTVQEEPRAGWRRFLFRWGAFCLFAAVGVFLLVCLYDDGRLGQAVLIRFFNLGSVEPRFAHQIPWTALAVDTVKAAIVGVLTAALLSVHAFRVRGRSLAAWAIILVLFGDLLTANHELLSDDPVDVLEHEPAYLDRLQPEGEMVRFFGPEHAFRKVVHDLVLPLRELGKTEELEGSRVTDPGALDGATLDRLLRDRVYKSWPMVDKAFNAYSTNNFVSSDIFKVFQMILLPGIPPEAKKNFLAMLNCDRIVIPADPVRIFALGQREATRLVLLDEPLPRAYVVGGVKMMEDKESLLVGLMAISLKPPRLALIDRASAAGDSFDDLRIGEVSHAIHRLEYVPNGLEIDLESESAGMLILSDAYYPGWVATVNGNPTRIYNVNHGLRGIRIEAGRSRVEMRYEPDSLTIGLAISLTTLVILAILMLPRPKASDG